MNVVKWAKGMSRVSYRASRNGVKEISTGDMSEGEVLATKLGLSWIAIGTVVHVVAETTVGVVTAGSAAAVAMTAGKVMAVGGALLAVGGLGSAFTRGFIEQMKTELKTNQ